MDPNETVPIDQIARQILISNNRRPGENRPRLYQGKIPAYVHTFHLDDNWVCMLTAIGETNQYQAAHKVESFITDTYNDIQSLLESIIEKFGYEHAPMLRVPFS